MGSDKPDLLTTGQAAKLCAVTPDTVLKWIELRRGIQGKEEPPEFAEAERSFRMGRPGQECLQPSLILRSTISLGSHPDSFRNALDAAVALEREARLVDGIYLTTAPHSLPSLDGMDKTSLPVP